MQYNKRGCAYMHCMRYAPNQAAEGRRVESWHAAEMVDNDRGARSRDSHHLIYKVHSSGLIQGHLHSELKGHYQRGMFRRVPKNRGYFFCDNVIEFRIQFDTECAQING